MSVNMQYDLKFSRLSVKYPKEGQLLEKCGMCNSSKYTLEEPFVSISPPVLDVPLSVPFHWKCLVTQLLRESPFQLEWFEGFEQLLYNDQEKMRKELETLEKEEGRLSFPKKTVGLSDVVELTEQSKEWQEVRRFLSKQPPSKVISFLRQNKQLVRGYCAKEHNTVERLTDLFCFGVPVNCSCGGIQVLDVARRDTKCTKTTANPKLSRIKTGWSLKDALRLNVLSLPTAAKIRLFHDNSKWIKNVNGYEMVKEIMESRFEAAKSVRREFNEKKKWVDGSWKHSGKYAVHRNKKGVSYNASLHFASAAQNINSSCKLILLKEGGEEFLAIVRGRFGVLETAEYEKVKKRKGVEKFEETFLLHTGNKWKKRSKFISKPGFFEQLDRDVVIEPLSEGLEDLMLVVAEDGREKVKNRVHEARVIYHQCQELFPRGFFGTGMVRRAEEHLEILAGKTCGEEEKEGRWDRVHSLLPQLCQLDAPKKVNVDELLQKLKSVEVVVEEARKEGSIIKDPFKEMYQGLGCKAKLITASNRNFDLISTYFRDGFEERNKDECLLKSIYEITPGKVKLSNKNPEKPALLWHGTEAKNLKSIMTHGLQPGTQGTFGAGLYFADASQKAVHYCDPPESRGMKVLLLFKVNRGSMYKQYGQARFLSLAEINPPFNSVYGEGRCRPGGKWWIGPEFTYPTGSVVEDLKLWSQLEFNEYCIYEQDRCQLAFVVLFDHKKARAKKAN